MKTKEIVSETLYRKYRPENFDDVLGQDEVVSALKNSLVNKSISHAYLFSGGRGSGKTSVARIFAKELKVNPSDIYEIDAASNRGIEQIRELRDAVNILPMESDYKVYIIDEVHMLTKEAFNALLKTLEEPPKHVIFILATTEKYKILETIVSRCQVFNFKKAELNVLSELIKKVAEKEKVKIDDEAVLEIARAGDGSFRNTISELQKNIALFGQKIEIKNFQKNTNLIDAFIENISDKEKLFSSYKEILKSDLDIEFFLEELLKKVREILLIKNSKEMEEWFSEEYSKEDIKIFKENKTLNASHLKKILEALDFVKKTGRGEVAMEIFISEL